VACLDAGVNDLGGTLMNETISRSAGAAHGQEMTASAMEAMLLSMGRVPRQRTTLYGQPAEDRKATARSVSTPLPPVRIDFPRAVAATACAD